MPAGAVSHSAPSQRLIEDAGDGWWHCATPLRCRVIAVPAAVFLQRTDARWPETYWLVRTDPPIEWHGDARFAARWGQDHPLCSPIEPTPFALVMANSSWDGPIDPARDFGGVPVYPVRNTPSRVEDAELISGLAIKAGLRPIPPGTTQLNHIWSAFPSSADTIRSLE